MSSSFLYLILFILAWAPLSFGARSEWSFGVIAAGCFWVLADLMKQARSGRRACYTVPGILPLKLLLLWMAIQSIPLPVWLVDWISPKTVSLYQQTIGIVEPVGWVSISIHPRATLMELLRFGTYTVFYYGIVQLLTQKEFLKKTVKTVATFSAAIAAFAILQSILSPAKIYGFRSVPFNATPFGPYLYHNHFAGFMEMVFPISLVLFLWYRPVVRYGGIRYRVIELLKHPHTHIHLLFGLATILIGASVFLSYSRGGIISLCIALCLLSVLLIRCKPSKTGSHYFLFPLILVLVLFSVGWFGWDFIFHRFEAIRNADGLIENQRLRIWQDTLGIIKQYFLFGTGFGTFQDIYPAYQTTGGGLLFAHAHNDYLEFLATGGLVGTGLLLWVVFSVIGNSARMIRKRKEPFAVYLWIGAFTGIISIAIHGFLDFNLQNGANGLYFFFLLGLMVSVAHTRLYRGAQSTYLIVSTNKITKTDLALSWAGLMVVLMFFAGCMIAKYRFAGIEKHYLDETIPPKQLQEMLATAQCASLFDPLQARYEFGAGNLCFFLSRWENARRAYKKALRYRPTKGAYLQRMGLLLQKQGDTEKAEQLLLAGIRMDRGNPVVHRLYGLWLFAQGRDLASQKFLRQAIALDPRRENLNTCLAALCKNQAKPAFMLQLLPSDAGIYLHFIKFLQQSGLKMDPDAIYRKAIGALPRQKRIQPWYFLSICNYYLSQGKEDEALRVMRLARQRLPENVQLRIRSGDVYRRIGIQYRAVEEYQKALSLEPLNQAVVRKLNQLK